MFNKIKSNLPIILEVGIFVALFTSLIYPYADKDWGWHYKYGQYLLENGHILVRDIYSWTLAGYAWINHSWLFDPILYTLFNNFGYIGLSLLGAIVGIISFYLVTRNEKLQYWQLGIVAFFFAKIAETGMSEGLRSQVLALLPLSALMYVLNKARTNPNLFNVIPFIFLLWVNLHGTFAFGMMVLSVFFACYFFELKDQRKRLITTFLITFILTLFNPFTYHSYLEVIRHTGSPYLQNVFEWLPIYANCYECHVQSFSIYVVVLITALFVKPQKSEIPYFIIMLGLTYQAINARRYLPLYAVTTIPLLVSYLSRLKINFLNLDKYKITLYLTIFLIVFNITYNLTSRLPSFNFYKYSEADFCRNIGNCPMGALKYLKDHPTRGNGTNFYDWGGYMIGKGFASKIFVDGRMHLWSVRDYTPFGDYIKMYYNQDKKLFMEYDFDWALVQPNSGVAQMIQSGTVGNWKLQYQDDRSHYYVRLR